MSGAWVAAAAGLLGMALYTGWLRVYYRYADPWMREALRKRLGIRIDLNYLGWQVHDAAGQRWLGMALEALGGVVLLAAVVVPFVLIMSAWWLIFHTDNA